jgi:hypothetical protein
MEYLNEYNKHKWINDNLITEDTEFFQYQFSQNMPNPLGPSHGFAVDPSLSIYTGQDSPYTDQYSRSIGLINDLKSLIDFVNKDKSLALQKYDHFTEDIEIYDNLKILRMFKNQSNYLDIYISFEFDEKEYFGTFENFNRPYNIPKLTTDLYKDVNYRYIDTEYKLKLSNFLRKILNNWFIPKKGLWRNFQPDFLIKNSMGSNFHLKEKHIIDLKGYNIDENNNPYLIIEYKDKEYYIKGNDYYWFQWYFEKI